MVFDDQWAMANAAPNEVTTTTFDALDVPDDVGAVRARLDDVEDAVLEG